MECIATDLALNVTLISDTCDVVREMECKSTSHGKQSAEFDLVEVLKNYVMYV